MQPAPVAGIVAANAPINVAFEAGAFVFGRGLLGEGGGVGILRLVEGDCSANGSAVRFAVGV